MIRQWTDSQSANKKHTAGELHLEAFLRSMKPGNFHGSLDHGLQMELRGTEHHLVCLDAAEVQDVGDKSQKSFARTANGVHEVPLSR